MAKVIDSQHLIIEGTGEEFMKIGFGYGEESSTVIEDGIFAGFGMITVEPSGEDMCCDNCNEDIGASETSYYISVLNMVFCKECFDHWHKTATYYPEDRAYEEKRFENVRKLFLEKGVTLEERAQA